MIRRNEAKETDGALKILAALEKGKALKRCKITVCVVGLSAAFGVDVVAFDGVPTESVAASQADSNVATRKTESNEDRSLLRKWGPARIRGLRVEKSRPFTAN
ncbi:MAG: hypothetical protein IJE77_14385 [Thermoguttaceae bacterium]|nr:hypothetical protein [Thermoguttaceae bacterium]